MSEVFPTTPQLLFGEFFYQSSGADVHFDAEFEPWSLKSAMRVHAKNATLALAYTHAEAIVCPTPFQASTLPAVFQPRVRILHEGVDLDRARRIEGAAFRLPDGRMLDGSRPVITFINRTLERLRGFHVFMRALPALLAARPDAEVIIIGQEDGRGYGSGPSGGATWKGKMLAELGDGLDLSRVHFVGRVAHEEMVKALSLSWAHVYLTYPFVLSWSLVEAMGCGCLIVGSDTAPVRDAITHGRNGLLVDFFDTQALARTLIEACADPRRHDALRAAAVVSARAQFDRASVGVPGWMALIEEFSAKRVAHGLKP
jgi:glycosyltransferase involved in cell wall biosynthesis